MEMNLRKALLDAAQHALMPVDLQIGMQPSLHQHTSAPEFNGLPNLIVDGFEIENVPFLRCRSLQRTVEGAEGTVFRAEIGVINVAIDDVSNRTLRMLLATDRVRLHADAHQIIGAKHFQRLLLG